MSRWQPFLKLTARIALLMLLAFFILMVLVAFGLNEGRVEVLLHLIGGFIFFLNRNIPAISVNAATWVPGVIAFLLVLAVGHQFLRAWARKRNREFGFDATLCLGLVLPVLFCVSFIVPGVLLQVISLRENKWFEGDRQEELQIRADMMELYRTAFEIADADPEKRLPQSLSELIGANSGNRQSILRDKFRSSLPSEPPIILGSGMTMASNPSSPFMISPPFTMRGLRYRLIIGLDGRTKRILDKDLEASLERIHPGMEAPAPLVPKLK